MAANSKTNVHKGGILIAKATRERLKFVAASKGIQLYELIETVCDNYVRSWEKLHHVDLDKMREVEARPARTPRRS